MTTDEPRKLAIACQGGGALTAWQAGLLGELLTKRTLDKLNRLPEHIDYLIGEGSDFARHLDKHLAGPLVDLAAV